METLLCFYFVYRLQKGIAVWRLYNVFTSCIVYRKVSQGVDFIMFLLRVSFTERYRSVETL